MNDLRLVSKMKKSHYYWSLIFFIEITGTFVDINEIKNNILKWKQQNTLNFSEIGASSSGIFDFTDVKNKILQWKNQKLAALCPTYGAQLQNLLNLVCSTAQPTNITLRDGCITCFSRVTSMPEEHMTMKVFGAVPEVIWLFGLGPTLLIAGYMAMNGPQELTALSTCATQYFVNTTYAACATALATLASSALNVQPSGCFMGYCDFVRCLRRTNSINLVTQCTREARTGVNITLDADNVRFYTNVTSCILAKSRCSTYNPITGDPQTPGYTTSGTRVSNALQFSAAGELRVLAFSATTAVSTSFCSTSSNLTQTSWLTNVC